MIKYIKEHILAVTIGVAGFLSALVTMFVNLNETVNVKWLIFTIFIMLIVIVTLIGIIVTDRKIRRTIKKYSDSSNTKQGVALSLARFGYNLSKLGHNDDEIETIIEEEPKEEIITINDRKVKINNIARKIN